MKFIGMRNIKTSIAVFLCILLYQLLGRGFPFFACVAAIITMDTTIYNSFNIGKNRVIGTLIGAFIGILFYLMNSYVTYSFLSIFVICLGLSMTIYFCYTLGYEKSISIAGIVFIAIINNSNKDNILSYSMNRILETLLGILIAVTVNYIIYPPDLKKQIHNLKEEIKANLLPICTRDFSCYNHCNLEVFSDLIKSLNSSILSYEDEFKSHKDMLDIKSYKSCVLLFNKLYNHLSILNIVLEENNKEVLDFHLEKINNTIDELKCLDML